MINLLLYNRQKAELTYLEKETRDAVADVSDDEIRISRCLTGESLQAFLEEKKLSDLGMLDVSGKKGLERVLSVRGVYPEMEIMLIADRSMSPLEYIKPGVRAASLLLRPFDKAGVRTVLREFLGAFQDSLKEEQTDERALLLKSRDGVTRLPYHQICYIEARMKKIFIRTEGEEFGYYDTLEHLMESLPGEFVRCHRAFVVNRTRVKRLDAAENLLVLDNGMEIPVSRSQKGAIRNAL